MKYTEDEIKLAKEIRDKLKKDSTNVHLFLAGKICMWDELSQANEIETSNDSEKACLTSEAMF